MQIELEIYILLVCCLLFTFLYEVFREREPSGTGTFEFESSLFGVFASGFWMVFSLVYFVAAGIQSRPTTVVSLFFSGIGIIYIVRLLIDLLNMGRWAKQFGRIET